MKKILKTLFLAVLVIACTSCGQSQKERQADEGVKKAYNGLSDKRLK